MMLKLGFTMVTIFAVSGLLGMVGSVLHEEWMATLGIWGVITSLGLATVFVLIEIWIN